MAKEMGTVIAFMLRTRERFLKHDCGYYIADAGLVKRVRQNHRPPREEDVEICKKFLRRFIDRRETINRHSYHSYGLKHAVEKIWEFEKGLHVYIPNGALIAAAAELGYEMEPVGNVFDGERAYNAVFNMDFNRLREFRRRNNLIFA